MKIYTNEQHEIVAIGHSTNPALACHELPDDESNFFHGKCDAFILGYRYRAEDGTTEISPYKSYHILESIQAQWEADQAEITALQLALAEQYEANLALEEEVTNTQMALTEIYEGMGV